MIPPAARVAAVIRVPLYLMACVAMLSGCRGPRPARSPSSASVGFRFRTEPAATTEQRVTAAARVGAGTLTVEGVVGIPDSGIYLGAENTVQDSAINLILVGRSSGISFAALTAYAYTATFDQLRPGRYRLRVSYQPYRATSPPEPSILLEKEVTIR